MRKPLYIIIIICFFAISLIAQTATVKGVLKDKKTGEALIGASIISKDDNGTTTDINGNYSFVLPTGNHTLAYSYIGYIQINKKISLVDGQTLELNLNLSQDSEELSIVVVSGSKYERQLSEEVQSIEVINSDLLDNSNTVSLAEGIGKVSGVIIQDNQISIRGGAGYAFGVGSRVKMLIDGLPYLSLDRGEIRWDFVPVEIVEQVEVIKNASSAMYGASALNGVVNVHTIYPKSDSVKFKAVFYSTIYNKPKREETAWWLDDPRIRPMRYGAYFGASKRFKRHDLVLGGNMSRSTGVIRLYDLRHMRFDIKYRFKPKRIKGLSFGVTAMLYDALEADYFFWKDADANIYYSYGAKPEEENYDGIISSRTRRTINIDPWIKYIDKFENQYLLRTRYNRNYLKYSSAEQFAHIYYSEFQFKRTIQLKNEIKATIIAGIYNEYGDLTDPSILDAISEQAPEGEVNSVQFWNPAAYAQFDLDTRLFNLQAGARIEHIEVDTLSMTKPVFSIGVNYKAGKSSYLRGSVSQGFRFPSIVERFAKEKLNDDLGLLPNPDLKPEFGVSYEIGFKQAFKISNWKAYFDLALFGFDYWDMVEFNIIFALEEDFTLGIIAENVSRARIVGFEPTLVGNGNIGPIYVNFQGGYTYSYGAALNYDTTLVNYGKFLKYAFKGMKKNPDEEIIEPVLKYRPRHLVKSDLELGYKGVLFGNEVRIYTRNDNIDWFLQTLILTDLLEYREAHSKAKVVWNVRLFYDFGKVGRIGLIVNNVLNNEYTIREARMEAPRSYTVQYKISF